MENYQIIQNQLKNFEFTVVDLVHRFLNKIENHKELNAYVHIWQDSALNQAKALDEKLNSNQKLGKLFGAIFSIKDNICYAGHEVSAASNILKDYKSPFSATVVQRLIAEDAIIIGSTNCDEFGMGSTSTHSSYGPVRNGFDATTIAGGSSGGAAVSVQMDTCHFALGSDTGGSVRQPAALCEVIGFKPSYGKISRHGLIAYASSFDQIGVITKDVNSIQTVIDIIAGEDGYDSTITKFGAYQSEVVSFDKIKVATFAQLENEANDYTTKVLKAISIIFSNHLEKVDFEFLDYLVPCYYILTTAEASSNLSRYDGVRFGHRSKNTSNLDDLYKNSRSEGFGAEVKKRIMLGTFVLSEGYFDAYYGQAQKVRRLIKDRIEEILKVYDVIAIPVTTSPPWKIGEKISDPTAVYLSDIFTVLANITGMPSISIPITNEEGGVVSMQLITTQGNDDLLLKTACSLQHKIKTD